MMGTLGISASLILIIFASTGHAQSCNRSDPTYVPCDHTTPVCECTDTECYFCLEIEQRHTFTRYFLTEKETDIPGYGGRVWYFNDQGQLEELPPEDSNDDSSTSSANNDPRCTETITVDGNTFRPILTINNRFPGPTLIVPNNSIVVVDVYNRLSSEATSIHWHGMHQMNTPWMDGVEHITQCGIAPSSSFRYIFRARPPGTHWYHSHSGAQRTDGLFGALIVKESVKHSIMHGLHPLIDEPENVITLLDWQKENSLDLFTQIHAGIRYFDQDGEPPGAEDEDSRQPRTCSPDGTEVGPVTYWSGLINGRGRHRDTPYNKTLLSRFNVKTHKYYRFRLIGAQSLFAYRFSIDEHDLTLIATDGHLVEPTVVDFIIVHSGERYDFILETKNPAEIANSRNNFMIRAETLEVAGSDPNICGDRNTPNPLYPLYTDHNAEAILHYGKESDIIGNTMYEVIAQRSTPKYEECARETNKSCIAVNCPFANFPEPYGITCKHIHELNLLVPPTNPNQLVDFNTQKTLFFNFGFEGDGSTSAVNGRNFVFPPMPLQLDTTRQSEIPNICNRSTKEICDEPNRMVTDECLCTHVFDIEGGETYRFVFTAVGPDRENNYFWNFAHPIHLHGHSFHVAKIGFGMYSNTTGRIERASDEITCSNNYICTSPQWSNNNPDMGRSDNRAPLKDTVLVPAGGYAVVYFKANNPGYWFLHCHIKVHQLEGMAVVINEARGSHNAPPKNFPDCKEFTWGIGEFKQKESMPKPVRSTGNFLVPGLIIGLVITTILLLISVFIICLQRAVHVHRYTKRDKRFERLPIDDEEHANGTREA